ncbi:MAG TPA: hypothetical protein DCS93_37485 [Microscillaceae bacterium]|nr:hypothetical protein [Microscillaceae bacterium]
MNLKSRINTFTIEHTMFFVTGVLLSSLLGKRNILLFLGLFTTALILIISRKLFFMIDDYFGRLHHSFKVNRQYKISLATFLVSIVNIVFILAFTFLTTGTIFWNILYAFYIPIILLITTFWSFRIYSENTSSHKVIPIPSLPDATIAESVLPKRQILVTSGNMHQFILVKDIAIIVLQNNITVLYTHQAEKLFIDQSLKDLMGCFPALQFFRANRQTIVARDLIKSYVNIEARKMRLELTPVKDAPHQLIISKETALKLKKWIIQDT